MKLKMIDKMNFGVIIPARYNSSRFPGKPLVDIFGKPMIQHVWEKCCSAVGNEKVYIATDDVRIKDVVENFGGKVVMTSEECMTGTDRLAEANIKLNLDFIVNVQGDEPLINPMDINKVINAFLDTGNVTNAMCSINSKKEFKSLSVPKVTFSKNKKLLYMSRAGIPQSKTDTNEFGFKQVCIYAFSKEQLAFFHTHNNKTYHENIEDIEILRFIESDFTVDMVEVEKGSIAVDTPDDLERVRDLIKN